MGPRHLPRVLLASHALIPAVCFVQVLFYGCKYFLQKTAACDREKAEHATNQGALDYTRKSNFISWFSVNVKLRTYNIFELAVTSVLKYPLSN